MSNNNHYHTPRTNIYHHNYKISETQAAASGRVPSQKIPMECKGTDPKTISGKKGHLPPRLLGTDPPTYECRPPNVVGGAASGK